MLISIVLPSRISSLVLGFSRKSVNRLSGHKNMMQFFSSNFEFLSLVCKKQKLKPKKIWAKLPTGLYGWTSAKWEGASRLKRKLVQKWFWGIGDDLRKRNQVNLYKILSLVCWDCGGEMTPGFSEENSSILVVSSDNNKHKRKENYLAQLPIKFKIRRISKSDMKVNER